VTPLRRAAAVLLAAAIAGAALAGCGTPSPDLMVITRTGADRAANVTLRVGDGGTVECNGKEHALPGDELLDARRLVRDMGDQADLGLSLPPGPRANLRYSVMMQKGTIAFSDTSAQIPATFQRLAKFTKDVSEGVCGIER
jgi:hypothetical protein